MLKAAFVRGILDKDEFDLRIGRVLGSRTYAELAALTAGLPAGLTVARPLPVPARGSASTQAVKSWAYAATAYTVMSAAVAVATGSSPGERLAGVAVIFAPLTIMLVAALIALHAWLDRRAVRRSPPGGRACQGGLGASAG